MDFTHSKSRKLLGFFLDDTVYLFHKVLVRWHTTRGGLDIGDYGIGNGILDFSLFI